MLCALVLMPVCSKNFFDRSFSDAPKVVKTTKFMFVCSPISLIILEISLSPLKQHN